MLHKGEGVIGQMVTTGQVVTGRVLRSAAPVDGREVVLITDPTRRTPVHIYADTLKPYELEG